MTEHAPLQTLTSEYFQRPGVAARIPELRHIAAELQINRTPASDDPGLEGLNPIPVGAHQDGDYVWSALEGHVRSLGPNGSPRVQVLLSLNNPPGASEKVLNDAVDAARTFAEENPGFPLSYYRKVYPKHTPIGTVRGDLLDGGLLWSQRPSGLLTPLAERSDIAAIINDIDELQRAPSYADLMLDRLADPGVIAVRGLAEYNASGYHNIDKMLRWRTVPFKAGVSGCEFNYAFSIRDVYLAAGGYDRSDTASETRKMISRSPLFASRQGRIETAEGATITSSNRHLVEAGLKGTPPWKMNIGLGVGDAPYRTVGQVHEGRDFTNAEYSAAIEEYQREILRNGGPIAYRRGGQDGLEKLMVLMKTACEELGDSPLSQDEIQTFVDQILAETV